MSSNSIVEKVNNLKKGVLIINLGTPKSPEVNDVKKYLKKFLSDPRVIQLPRWFWLPLLNGVILQTRPKKSAQLYQQIYTDHGFPLLHYTQAQKEHLAQLLPDYEVGFAMSYSEPSIEDALDAMLAKKVTDLTIVPMYPQYSGTTVGSVFDSVMNYFKGSDKIVTTRFIRSYYDHPDYIQYFAEKIKNFLTHHQVDAILFSYHGLPESYVQKGDTYPDECHITTQEIMAKVGPIQYFESFQSKFGPGKWLTPATDALMKELPTQGIKNLLVVAPGFVVDCLETIEELEEENKSYFLQAGGQHFYYLPPFNADSDFAQLVVKLLS